MVRPSKDLRESRSGAGCRLQPPARSTRFRPPRGCRGPWPIRSGAARCRYGAGLFRIRTLRARWVRAVFPARVCRSAMTVPAR